MSLAETANDNAVAARKGEEEAVTEAIHAAAHPGRTRATEDEVDGAMATEVADATADAAAETDAAEAEPAAAVATADADDDESEATS